MGKNIKQHDKIKFVTVIEKPDGTLVSGSDYELRQVLNERGGNPTLWWVNRKDFQDRFRKVKGDVDVREETK